MADLIAIGRKGQTQASTGAEAVSVAADEIHVTEAAARKIQEKLEAEGQAQGVFRVGVMGGGCSGLTYRFAVEAAAGARDRVFEAHGVRVVVDPKSLGVIGGTVLDWKQELGKAQFWMRNPHAKSACSCGASFAL